MIDNDEIQQQYPCSGSTGAYFNKNASPKEVRNGRHIHVQYIMHNVVMMIASLHVWYVNDIFIASKWNTPRDEIFTNREYLDIIVPKRKANVMVSLRRFTDARTLCMHCACYLFH